MNNSIKIGITQGDTNGVGWEIILKIFADAKMSELCVPVIYGSKDAFNYYKKLYKEQLSDASYTLVKSASEARAKRINLVECGTSPLELRPGEATPEAAQAASASLTKCAQELKSGLIDAVVTAPINKESLNGVGFEFTGHTEFFAAQSGDSNEPLMFMCSEKLRVALVTKHIAVAQVASAISEQSVVDSIKAVKRSLVEDFEINEPRIAVMALNPHAGDGGVIGSEEGDVITPAIRKAYSESMMAFGPFAADGFFAAGGYAKYDAVLAIYHDQGLIPFKTLSPEGVNFTAGLSLVRTSPDHGTAYDIAGKGEADPTSMRNAIYMAIDVVASRKRYAQFSANPLQRAEREKSSGRDLSVKDMPQFKEQSR
ncbi:MAG: 4-hydroxythreonine-4-phosphate dehydrogenase PdxA [Rikenellaceae bacterium]